MSRAYKTYEGGLFFVTLTVVGWIDVFTRSEYCDTLVQNLKYCQEKKGLQLYAYCIMSSHVHLIAAAETGTLSDILQDFKSYTAKQLLQQIQDNPQESRKDWLLFLFRHFARKNNHNIEFQFWQHHNHPIDLVNNKLVEQKVNYIHQNPVIAGLVNEPQAFTFSSANPLSPLTVLPV
ncbi:REP-associated tyrosine transposase [Adhaeribacter radiodurans]|uniref:Transposase n=1 Tax=Adhaeribacter radiodurans TaxID=2745197 RepID=A0A7L7LDJ9_9BACT|nr:transposase [Adhaeribacter radiodurans]QMU30827.1 transposase [Adhaeribacter radiodurans]